MTESLLSHRKEGWKLALEKPEEGKGLNGE